MFTVATERVQAWKAKIDLHSRFVAVNMATSIRVGGMQNKAWADGM
jgi:hypothetical protein